VREMIITNTRHACGPDLPVARGVRGVFRDYGFAWDNTGKALQADRMGGGLIFPLYPVEMLDSMAIACYFYLS
jgi:hypothetical protein